MTDKVAGIIAGIIAAEGGARYTNDPKDAGGPTKYGITAKALGAYRKLGRAATAVEVQNLQLPEAEAIYREQYVDAPGFGAVLQRSQKLGEELIDTGVNMGPGTAAIFLQKALNSLNREGADYADIGEDGDIGPGTLRALDGLIKARGIKRAEAVLFVLLNAQQAVRYMELTRPPRSDDNERFMMGWLEQRVLA